MNDIPCPSHDRDTAARALHATEKSNHMCGFEHHDCGFGPFGMRFLEGALCDEDYRDTCLHCPHVRHDILLHTIGIIRAGGSMEELPLRQLEQEAETLAAALDDADAGANRYYAIAYGTMRRVERIIGKRISDIGLNIWRAIIKRVFTPRQREIYNKKVVVREQLLDCLDK